MVNLVNTETVSNTTKTPMPNPMMAILFFFIVTSIYCILSIFIMDSTQRIIAKVCYVLFVVTGEYFINLNLTESMCGIRQWQSSFFITIFPWFLIFGVLHLFLTLFPGWKSPFSNTFGYLVAKLMGLSDFMKQILVEVNPDGSEASRALESVKTDNSLLINELYEESSKVAQIEQTDRQGNKKMVDKLGKDDKPVWERPKFKDAWDKLVKGNIIKPDYKNNDKMIDKLYFFVQMKFTIAEYIWNLLAGFLVTSISYNYIINAGCDQSPVIMQQKYKKYQSDEAERKQKKKQNQNKEPLYVQS